MNRNLIQKALAETFGRMGTKIADSVARAFLRNAVPWATYVYNGGIRNGTGSGPTYSPGPRLSVTEVKFDFAAIAADRIANSLAALAATDVLQAVGVKAGIWVPMCSLQTVTVEGAAATVDIGDGTSTAGYIDDANLNAAGWASSLITTAFSLATAGGKIYTVDDTIDLLVNTNATDVAVANLMVVMVDLRKVR